jgi:spermidine/putrescine transport system substrate-binding protein
MNDDSLKVERILQEFESGRMSRRRALKALAATSMAAAVAPFLGHESQASSPPMGPGGIQLARPDFPVKLPLWEDPIKSGLQPETSGTFNLFNYDNYIDKKLVDEFGKKYGVKTQITVFDSMDQAITKLASHSVDVDVTDITPDRISQAVAGKLIQPINLDYIPNLKANIWPSLHSPFYDVGSQYTVPYVTYTTGIGWRDDKIKEDIPNMENPWEIFWKSEKYNGYVGVLDDSRESLAMAMHYRKFYDVNTEDPKIINRALADLKALIPICNPKINITEYQTLPKGESWLHQVWSGDMLSAFFAYLPAGYDGSSLRFWSPPVGKGNCQNDCWAIVAGTKKPVLSHLWLNYLLDKDFAYNNFTGFNGYQPPQVSITADDLIAKKVIPENLRTAIFSSDAFGPKSMQLCALTPKGLALWQKAYAKFNAGN